MTTPLTARTAFGVDIGGSGIKGAPVDLAKGELADERHRIPTPQPSTPPAVAATVAELVDHFAIEAGAPIGLTFPAPIHHGVIPFIANLDQSWTGIDVATFMSSTLQRHVVAVNDADAAGVAEARFGAAKGVNGVVVVATLGTGIGTALLTDGVLVPNTELGHLEIDGYNAESRAAASVREREDLSWEVWAERLQRYFTEIQKLFSPDLIVVGGGVSKKHEKFLPLLSLRTPIVPAVLRNRAGIIGAAAMAGTTGLV